VSRDVLMSLLKTVVFLNVVEVISSYNNGSLHFSTGDANSFEDTSTNAHVSCEWAFPINVSSLDSIFWCLEAQTNVSYISKRLSGLLSNSSLLGGKENSGLLLESSLVLLFNQVNIGRSCMLL